VRLSHLQGNPLAESAASVAWSVGRALNHGLPAAVRRGAPVEREAGFDPSAAGGGGSSLPLSPRPYAEGGNPVLTAGDVTDYGRVDFVADPFLSPGPDRWHLFFEVYNGARDPPAVIGHATSPGGYEWTYDRVVLNTGVHLAFPYVFEHDGDTYLLPDKGVEGVESTVFRATEFPTDWEPVAAPVGPGPNTNDAVVFRRDGRWWLLAGDTDDHSLHVYWSDALEADDWTPHADNPVVEGRPRAFRPGGRPLLRDGRLVVFFQDCEEAYGHSLRAVEVTDLGPDTYADEELSPSPLLAGTGALVGWNAGRMHHFDPHHVDGRFLCAVDGNVNTSLDTVTTARHWSIGIYTA